MINFIDNHLDHILFVLLLISQIGHIGTTYIATPNLKLIDSPVVGKFRWPFLVLVSTLIPFVAYLNNRVALMLFVGFLLLSASNASKMWMISLLGEEEYLQLYSNLVRKASLSFSLFCLWAPSFFFFLLGIILYYFTEGVAEGAAQGCHVAAIAMGINHTSSYLTIKRKALFAGLMER